ncbi:MAG: PorP/SprF family type IX secretion system membrane protein [Bacteroidota bacterium]
MKIKFLLLPILLLLVETLAAQDKHFSLYNMAPIQVNPAQTGAFEGTVRLGGLYRGQWFAMSNSNGFQTPSFYADAPILAIGKKKRDWLGVGVMILNDQAGGISDSELKLSAAYHRSLDKKSRTVLTIGLQGGRHGRALDDANLRFGDAISSGTVTAGGYTLGTTSESFTTAGNCPEETEGCNNGIEFAAGAKLQTRIGQKADLTLGVALDHIAGARFNVVEKSDTTRRPLLTTLHGQFNTPLTDKLSLHPSILAQAVEGSPLELAVQALAAYKLNPENDISLRAGLGYRVNDAGEILVGVDYGDVRVMASYDLTTSELSNATTGGAFEIAAWYIIKIFKKPVVDPAVICPQL